MNSAPGLHKYHAGHEPGGRDAAGINTGRHDRRDIRVIRHYLDRMSFRRVGLQNRLDGIGILLGFAVEAVEYVVFLPFPPQRVEPGALAGFAFQEFFPGWREIAPVARGLAGCGFFSPVQVGLVQPGPFF